MMAIGASVTDAETKSGWYAHTPYRRKAASGTCQKDREIHVSSFRAKFGIFFNPK